MGRKISFTEGEVAQLSHESIHHPHHIVRRRMQALLLKSQNVPHYRIARILDVSETTLREYLDLYMKGGLEALKTLNYKGRTNELMDNSPAILAHFEVHPPDTLRDAQAKIEAVTGIRRSLPQISEFLRRVGVRTKRLSNSHSKRG